MNWLRLYHSTLESRKIQSLPDREFKAWVNMLIVASKNTPRGALPPLKDLCFSLRLREDFVQRLISKFTRERLLDEVNGVFFMHDWGEHQFASDDVNQRVAKHRQGQRNVTGNVTGNGPDSEVDTDTDSDTEAERELTEKQPDGPAPKFSAPEEREPVSTGESLNEWEQEIWNYLSPREIRGKRVDLGTVKRLAAIAQKVPGHRQKELWKKIHHTVISDAADGFGLLITIARGFLAGGFVATTNNRVAPPKTANSGHSNGHRKPPGWEMTSEAAQYGAGGR